MQIGLFGLLFIVLLVLKLVGTITWSWWLVTAPLWSGVIFWVAVLMVSLGVTSFMKRRGY